MIIYLSIDYDRKIGNQYIIGAVYILQIVRKKKSQFIKSTQKKINSESPGTKLVVQSITNA